MQMPAKSMHLSLHLDANLHCVDPGQERMPTMTLTFFVLSMDKTGHIIWPTNFEAKTRAALRLQARALLQKMMDDPLNPVLP